MTSNVAGSVEFAVPPLYCPIPPARHPRADLIEQRVIGWLDAHRLYRDDTERAWGIATGSTDFASRVLPDGDDAAVALFAMWNHLAFALDDWHDAGTATTSAAEVIDLNWRVIRTLEAAGAQPMGGSPFGPALDDLVAITRATTTPVQFHRFAEAVRDWLFAAAWAAAHTERRMMPTVDDYVGIRASINGIRFSLVWIEIAGRFEVPAEDWSSPAVQALIEMAGFLGGVDNDLIGYAKDTDLEVPEPNLVNVIITQFTSSVPDAFAEAVSIRDQVMARFLVLREQVATTAAPRLRRYLDGLGHYVRGVLDWTNAAARYASPRNRNPLPVFGASVGVAVPASPAHDPPSTAPAHLPSIAWWWNP